MNLRTALTATLRPGESRSAYVAAAIEREAAAKAEADARSTSAIAIEPPPPIQYSVETQQPLPPQGAPPSGAHRA